MVALIALAALLLPVAGLAGFAVASLRWGVDSRDESDDPRRPHRPVGFG